MFPPLPFPPGITKSEQGGLSCSAGSLLPLPAPAAGLLLMSRVAWGCHLPRGGSSPCTMALISCGNRVSSLACGCCCLFPCFSLEKLLFSRRAVFARFLLPGRGRVKWLVGLLLYEGRWRRWKRSTVGRDRSFPLRIYPTHTMRTGSLRLRQLGRKWEMNRGKSSSAATSATCGTRCWGQRLAAISQLLKRAHELDVTQICQTSKQ